MPADERTDVDAGVHGWCDPSLRRVREVFTEHFASGEEVGAAVCVYVGDELVADLWGGVADIRTGRPWQRDTPCLPYSCTKALTAACALHLWEQGAYAVDEPVTRWWPEFGQAGKQDVTAAHLLSHQAGLPAFATAVSVADTADPAALAGRLAGQRPEWEPGTAHGYHALTFGWLAGEIVRRLTGKTVGEYLAERIAGPHGLDLWLGAPDAVIERAAKLTTRRLVRAGGNGDAAARAGPAAPGPASAAQTDPERLAQAGTVTEAGTAMAAAGPAGGLRDRSSLLARTLYNPDATSVPRGNNNPAVLRAGWPASGALVSAAGLAGFYRHMIAGRILHPATLEAALQIRASGLDLVLGIHSAFGLGFMRPSWTFPVPPAARRTAFGHNGVGGATGLGDPAHGIAMAYIPNRMGDAASGDQRASRLIEAVYAGVA